LSSFTGMQKGRMPVVPGGHAAARQFGGVPMGLLGGQRSGGAFGGSAGVDFGGLAGVGSAIFTQRLVLPLERSRVPLGQ
jgi:hypothetical protein